MQIAHALVEIVAGDVPGDPEEDLEDRLALLRVLELVIFEEAGERALFDLVRHRSDGNRRTRAGQIAEALRSRRTRLGPQQREVVARGGVVAIEHERAFERAHRVVAPPGSEIGEAEVVLDLRRARGTRGRGLERAHRARRVATLERLRALAVQPRAFERAAADRERAQRERRSDPHALPSTRRW